MLGRIGSSILAIGLACLGLAQNTRPIQVTLDDAWDAQRGSPVVTPMRVSVTNSGLDAVAIVTYRNDQTSFDTPLELPTGTTKVVEFAHYAYGGYDARVFVRVGATVQEFPVPFFSAETNGLSYAMITDRPNELSFFTELRNFYHDGKPWTKVSPLHSRPELAPTRAVYYAALDGLVLGTGSERLSDDATAAIQSGMVQGLKVIIPGGTESPILRDPRWRSLLPADVAGTQNVGARALTLVAQNDGPFGTATILNLRPKLSAFTIGSPQQPEAAIAKIGRGELVMLAFDPFEDPFRTWIGRGKVLTSLSTSDAKPNPADQQGAIRYGRQTPLQFAFQGSMPSYSKGTLAFPPVSRIAAVLIGFAILAVPVNFLLLRKLGKGELAWITAPIISLFFAGLVLSGTGELYQRSASRSSAGIVTGHEGVGLNFEGQQQFFIPRAGKHDLKLTGIEVLSPPPDEFGMYRGGMDQRRQNDSFLELGQIIAPAYTSTSLSFREFALYQRLPAVPMMGRLRATREGAEVRVTGEVTNTTGSTISQAQIQVGGVNVGKPTNLAPGQSIQVNTKAKLDQFQRAPARLKGFVDPAVVGSQFGVDESLDNTVSLDFGLNVEAGS